MAMTIAEIADLYLTDKRRTRRESTVEGYASALRLHVLPRWGGMALEEIDPDSVQDWVASFELPGAAEKAYKTLRQVIRWAIRRLGLRVYDPTTAGIELPRKPAYHPQVLDASQARDYLRGLWGCEAEAAAICSLTLGLRRGESCALTWGDVNLKTGEVRVSKSRQDVRSGTVVVPPKTDRSDRSLWLPSFALRRLRQLAKGRRKSDLVCPLSPTATARRIRSWCRSHGLPHVSMTNLRHSWATIAIEAGVGIETVAMMLGHTEIGTAYEHYIVPRKSVCVQAQRAWAAHLQRSA
ncbi:MAG TPA: site-specific integrase [Candidatus Aphodovivens avistercoris]|nr:site-specific integrase [Candidatus Aphodovivens avistercoris]